MVGSGTSIFVIMVKMEGISHFVIMVKRRYFTFCYNGLNGDTSIFVIMVKILFAMQIKQATLGNMPHVYYICYSYSCNTFIHLFHCMLHVLHV